MKRILLAENEGAVRRPIKVFLNGAGYDVEEAKDGKEALEKLLASQSNTCPFDLLMTEIFMPGMTGLELIDEIRKQRMDLPILVISAYCDHRIQAQLLRRGCQDFIAKPFGADELLKRVARVLAAPVKGVKENERGVANGFRPYSEQRFKRN